MEEVLDRIKHLKETSIFYKKSLTTLNNIEVKLALNDLHEKYVFTPIDKANNNIAIICKKFYISTLIRELGLYDNVLNSNKTYDAIDDIQENIIQGHCTYLSNLKLNVDDANRCIPNISEALSLTNPKFPKQPSKARFIIAAPKCSLKLLGS